MSNRYDPSLLPAIAEINETWTLHRPCSLWDFVNYRGDMQLGYAFAALFIPDFVEVDGAVILAEHSTHSRSNAGEAISTGTSVRSNG